MIHYSARAGGVSGAATTTQGFLTVVHVCTHTVDVHSGGRVRAKGSDFFKV